MYVPKWLKFVGMIEILNDLCYNDFKLYLKSSI